MSEKKRIKKYFPNRIKEVMSVPEELLNGFDFEDIYNKSWGLRPGKEFVIRGARRGRPMDVTERSFSSPGHAKRFMDQLFQGNYEVTVATNNAVFMLHEVVSFDDLDEEGWM